MSLKQKTISGMFWSFADNFVNLGANFVIGVILARLLLPQEFGLVGMIFIFIAISQSFVDSGFSQALIRKSDCQPVDYCTVFFFNLLIAVVCYAILFVFAGTISDFFAEPRLLLILRVLGVTLLISAFGLVQGTILTKNVNFKLLTKISIISSLTAGLISVWLAWQGWGVWSLVGRMLIQNVINVGLLWVWNAWKPSFLFSLSSLREMFGFGSKLMISGLIDTAYKNIYYVIIGKVYSAADLGYYAKADNFQKLPSQNLTNVINRVSYPVLATIHNDDARLKRTYRKLITNTMLISFVLMIGMAASALAFIVALIGEKWLPAVPYLQLMCFSGMLYPLHSLNLSMLKVKGRSDLFLWLEIIKKTLAVPVIMIGIFIGIKAMLIGMIVNSVIAYFLNSFWSGKLVNYPVSEQLRDLAPSFFSALLMGVSVYFAGSWFSLSAPVALLIQMVLGVVIILAIGEMFRLENYLEIKGMVAEKISVVIGKQKGQTHV